MKYTNKGNDRMGTTEDGLRYNWTHGSWEPESEPQQTCAAHLGYNVILQVIDWSYTQNDRGKSNYGEQVWAFEPQIRISDETIRYNYGDGYHSYDEGRLPTRLEAQHRAEQMLIELRNELTQLIGDQDLSTYGKAVMKQVNKIGNDEEKK